MEFSSYFAVWDKLTPQQQSVLEAGVVRRTVQKGTVIHNGNLECTGRILVKAGQLRA